jgi:hypothetical protein
MNLITPNRVNEPTRENFTGQVARGKRHAGLPLKVHHPQPSKYALQIKLAMLRDSASVDISRIGETIRNLHATEKEKSGASQRKVFDLLKEHFKLRKFFKTLDQKIAQLETQSALINTHEQFIFCKRKCKDLQTEFHLYQEMRFQLGKSYLNCKK